MVVSVTFAIELGQVSGEMHICMPYSMIEPIKDLLTSSLQAENLEVDKRWIRLMRQQVQMAEVEIVADLGTAAISLRDIVNMKVGDVIPLDIPRNDRGQGGRRSGHGMRLRKIQRPVHLAGREAAVHQRERSANRRSTCLKTLPKPSPKTTGLPPWPNRPPPPRPLRRSSRSCPAAPYRSGHTNDIDFILDIPVLLTVELGRTKIAIKNLLQLAQGSVVELDGMAGEPMDVLVNGCLIAQGEVVVVNDKFGVRLTDIITPAERIRKLNK